MKELSTFWLAVAGALMIVFVVVSYLDTRRQRRRTERAGGILGSALAREAEDFLKQQ
ncbi:MAG: hypothetical protein M0000_13190 [Actinomycetota bacterium]|nr:hypothetical protein [Actinomycetota bacterium]